MDYVDGYVTAVLAAEADYYPELLVLLSEAMILKQVEALLQRLINEDKGRQDVLLNLAFQFEDSCAVRDDLRKAYEKCNDILKESNKYFRHNTWSYRLLVIINDFPLYEERVSSTHMEEEAPNIMLEERGYNKKAHKEEHIRQEQA
ncbi:hypothetical protein Tco_0033380 [Tanacetum coccineum]